MKDATTGESKGYAFVRFTSPKFAKLAVQQVDGTIIKGRKIGVVHSNDNQTLFLGHLDKDWKQEDLQRLLNEAKIKGVNTITLMKACDFTLLPFVSSKKNQHQHTRTYRIPPTWPEIEASRLLNLELTRKPPKRMPKS